MKSKLMRSNPENNYLFTSGCERKYVDLLRKNIEEIPVYLFFIGVLIMLFIISGVKAWGFPGLWSVIIVLVSWISLYVFGKRTVESLKQDLEEALQQAGALLTTIEYDLSSNIDFQNVSNCSIRTNPGTNYLGWILRMSFIYNDVCYVAEKHPSHIGHFGWRIFVESNNSAEEICLDEEENLHLPILANSILQYICSKYKNCHPQ